jgi:hypothetical protein
MIEEQQQQQSYYDSACNNQGGSPTQSQSDFSSPVFTQADSEGASTPEFPNLSRQPSTDYSSGNSQMVGEETSDDADNEEQKTNEFSENNI